MNAWLSDDLDQCGFNVKFRAAEKNAASFDATSRARHHRDARFMRRPGRAVLQNGMHQRRYAVAEVVRLP